ncbi:helix-turn-helix domain-containing protein [Aerococcus urinaeequi]|uniref:helix-turn-helix domain-containing protein n=1 Tax=Aerococcus urinaeequi TaxID=51665 RepID=UPI003D6B66D5
MEQNKRLGERIKKIRKKLGMSQLEFSKAIGATKSAVSNWENGYNAPNNERLKAIANLGNTTVDALLYGSLNERVGNLLNAAIDSDNPTYNKKLDDLITDYLVKHENLIDIVIGYNPDADDENIDIEQAMKENFINQNLPVFINKFDIQAQDDDEDIINKFIGYVKSIIPFDVNTFEGVKKSIFYTLEQINPKIVYTQETIEEFIDNDKKDKYRKLKGETLKDRIDQYYIYQLHSRVRDVLGEVIDEYVDTIYNKVDEDKLNEE